MEKGYVPFYSRHAGSPPSDAKTIQPQVIDKYKVNLVPNKLVPSLTSKGKKRDTRYGLEKIPRKYLHERKPDQKEFNNDQYFPASKAQSKPEQEKHEKKPLGDFVQISREEYAKLKQTRDVPISAQQNQDTLGDPKAIEELEKKMDLMSESVLNLKAEKLQLQKQLMKLTSERQQRLKSLQGLSALEKKVAKLREYNDLLKQQNQLLESKLGEQQENVAEVLESQKIKELEDLNQALRENLRQVTNTS